MADSPGGIGQNELHRDMNRVSRLRITVNRCNYKSKGGLRDDKGAEPYYVYEIENWQL